MNPPASPAPRTHWPAVLAAVAGGVAVGMNVGKVPLALPTLRTELGLGLVQAGFIYMAKLQVNHATFQAARLGSLGRSTRRTPHEQSGGAQRLPTRLNALKHRHSAARASG
mgnify:CR=1 FL=1